MKKTLAFITVQILCIFALTACDYETSEQNNTMLEEYSTIEETSANLSDWNFNNMMGITRFVAIYDYNLNYGYVRKKYKGHAWHPDLEFTDNGYLMTCDFYNDKITNTYNYSIISDYVINYGGETISINSVENLDEYNTILIKASYPNGNLWLIPEEALNMNSAQFQDENIDIYFRALQINFK